MGDDQDFAEKRDFIRMFMNAPVEYKLNNSDSWATGTGIDLSGSGVSFSSSEALSVGDELLLKVNPVTPVTPSLEVEVTVTRCEDDNSGEFIISSKINNILN